MYRPLVTGLGNEMSGLPREVLRWLQSLDLSYGLKNPRRDFSNGHLIAEILAWYHPREVDIESYNNGSSLQSKMANWQLLERTFTKLKFDIPKEHIEGTIHCKPLAGALLVERLYTLLTCRELNYCPTKGRAADFNDSTYQSQLTPHARSTASQCLKTNLAITELKTETDLVRNAVKAENILQVYFDQKQQYREECPERYGLITDKKKAHVGHTATEETTKLPEIIVKQKPPPSPL